MSVNLPWLVADVDSHVRVEGRAAIKRFEADVTLVRFLLGVYYLVATQGARLSESLAANLAHERPDTCVNGHVSGEIVVGVETFATVIALEHFATVVVVVAVIGCAAT